MARVEKESQHEWRYNHKLARYQCSHCSKEVTLEQLKRAYSLGIFNPEKVASRYINFLADCPAEIQKEEQNASA